MQQRPIYSNTPTILTAFLRKLGDGIRSGEASGSAGVVNNDSFVPMAWMELSDLSKESDEAKEFTPLEYCQQRLIRFSPEQATVLSATLPSIVYGPAGCGKSSAALSLFAQYVREHYGEEDAFPIVYVSRSKALVEEMRRLWLGMNPEGATSDAVFFKTYDELLIEQAGIDAERIVDERDFYRWYGLTYVEITHHRGAGAGSAKGDARLEAKLVWQELRIRSGYADDGAYYALGARQSVLDEGARAQVCATYHAYQAHLKNEGLLSPSLYSFALESAVNPKLVVVDEAQDLSYQQLQSLNRFSNGSVLYLLGEHQVLFDGKSRLNYLREMFRNNGQKPSVIALHGTYRCSEQVSAVAR